MESRLHVASGLSPPSVCHTAIHIGRIVFGYHVLQSQVLVAIASRNHSCHSNLVSTRVGSVSQQIGQDAAKYLQLLVIGIDFFQHLLVTSVDILERLVLHGSAFLVQLDQCRILLKSLSNQNGAHMIIGIMNFVGKIARQQHRQFS